MQFQEVRRTVSQAGRNGVKGVDLQFSAMYGLQGVECATGVSQWWTFPVECGLCAWIPKGREVLEGSGGVVFSWRISQFGTQQRAMCEDRALRANKKPRGAGSLSPNGLCSLWDRFEDVGREQ
jgi:hypothetical protein